MPHRRTIPKRMSDAWLHMSATKIKAFHCPLRGFLEIILRRPSLLSPVATFGIALHYSFERFFRKHRRTRRYPFLERKAFLGQWYIFWWTAVEGSGASEAALAPFRRWQQKQNEERIRQGKKPLKPRKPHGFDGWSSAPQLVQWQSDEQPLIFFRWGNRILRDFHDDFHPQRLDGNQRFVEQRLSFRWHGLTFTGYVDLIEIGPKGGTILDYKLGLYGLPLLETDIQFTLYQLAWDAYFRPKHTDWPPLTRMALYNYHRRMYQELSMRTGIDFGLFLTYVTELSRYIEEVLTAEYRGAREGTHFQWHNPDDIRTGNFSPLLPRGDHCTYCSYYRECRERELGLDRRTCRELFLEHYQKKLKTDENQLPLFPSDLPLAQQGTQSYALLPRFAPGQPDLFPPHEDT